MSVAEPMNGDRYEYLPRGIIEDGYRPRDVERRVECVRKIIIPDGVRGVWVEHGHVLLATLRATGYHRL